MGVKGRLAASCPVSAEWIQGFACPFFTNYYFPSPHPLCEVPDLGVGGGRAGSRSAAAYGAGGGGKSGESAFPFFFLRYRSLQFNCKAAVTGALSRPRRSAARTPSQTLSTLL